MLLIFHDLVLVEIVKDLPKFNHAFVLIQRVNFKHTPRSVGFYYGYRRACRISGGSQRREFVRKLTRECMLSMRKDGNRLATLLMIHNHQPRYCPSHTQDLKRNNERIVHSELSIITSSLFQKLRSKILAFFADKDQDSFGSFIAVTIAYTFVAIPFAQ